MTEREEVRQTVQCERLVVQRLSEPARLRGEGERLSVPLHVGLRGGYGEVGGVVCGELHHVLFSPANAV